MSNGAERRPCRPPIVAQVQHGCGVCDAPSIFNDTKVSFKSITLVGCPIQSILRKFSYCLSFSCSFISLRSLDLYNKLLYLCLPLNRTTYPHPCVCEARKRNCEQHVIRRRCRSSAEWGANRCPPAGIRASDASIKYNKFRQSVHWTDSNLFPHL